MKFLAILFQDCSELFLFFWNANEAIKYSEKDGRFHEMEVSDSRPAPSSLTLQGRPCDVCGRGMGVYIIVKQPLRRASTLKWCWYAYHRHDGLLDCLHEG